MDPDSAAWAAFLAGLPGNVKAAFDLIQSRRGGTLQKKQVREFKKRLIKARSEEMRQYRKMFADSTRMKALCWEGIQARDSLKNGNDVQDFRHRIIRSYGLDGLHVVQAIQMRIPDMIRGALASRDVLPSEAERQVGEFLSNIDLHCTFISITDNEFTRAQQATRRLENNRPPFYAIAGRGDCANLAKRVGNIVVSYATTFGYSPSVADGKGGWVVLLSASIAP